MGWGLELDWHELYGRGCRLGIVDEVRVAHRGEPGGDYDFDSHVQRMHKSSESVVTTVGPTSSGRSPSGGPGDAYLLGRECRSAEATEWFLSRSSLRRTNGRRLSMPCCADSPSSPTLRSRSSCRRWVGSGDRGGRRRLAAQVRAAFDPRLATRRGFRLARVRNLGAATARGSYIVFIDGDCIPRRHFVAAVRRAALPGWFLAGKRVQMGPELSRPVLEDELPVARWSAATLGLKEPRQLDAWTHLTGRDRRRPWRPRLPDFAPQGNEYGFLTGVSRSDFQRVNGFDTRFVGWGDQDVDLAVRLRRLGRDVAGRARTRRCCISGMRAR